MQFLRKLGLGLSLFLYIPLLLLLPTMVSLNATIVKPAFIKETLVKAQVYEGLNSFIIQEVSKKAETAGNELLISSLQQAASATELQKVFEPPIDETYKWLENPDSKFNVKVSLEPLKQNLLKIMEQNLQVKLTGLPRCASRVPATTDPLEMTCIPQGMSVEQILAQAKSEIDQNKEILGDEQSVSIGDEASAQVSQEPATEQTTTEKKETPKIDNGQLKTYAKIYKWVKVGTPIVIGLSALATLGIALLSRPRYKGIRRVGVFMVVCGVMLLVTSLVMSFAIRAFLPVPATGGSLSASGTKVVDIISKKIVSINYLFTIIYMVGGIVSIIAGVVIKKVFKDKKPSSHIEQEDMLPKDDSLAGKQDPKPEEKPSEPKAEEPKPEKDNSKETKV